MLTAWLRTPNIPQTAADGRVVPLIVGYAAGALLVGAAFLLRVTLIPEWGGQSPFLLFVPAILVTSGLGGLGPGIIATVLSATLGLYPPGPEGVTIPEYIAAGIFTSIGLAMAWLGDRLLKARAATAAGTRNILAREAHLRSILATVCRHRPRSIKFV